MQPILYKTNRAATAFALLMLALPARSQLAPLRPQPPFQNAASPAEDRSDTLQHAQSELKAGTALTRRGEFGEAIPHLLAAREQMPPDYAANFNLSLCYVGTRQFKKAIALLEDLRKNGPANADIDNLLAQAYVGDGQQQPALQALQQAASQTPTNEKLYLFVGDACMDRRDYALGLKVVEIGLKALPESARLHYQKALFLSLVDEFDQARAEFQRAQTNAPGTAISALAAANEAMYAGDPQEAARLARDGVAKGYDDPTLLEILGEALIRTGVRPGDAAFTEAQNVLYRAAEKTPRNPGVQISLGKLCLMNAQPAEAIAHLNRARELDPGNAGIYTPLARAYQKLGDAKQAEAMLAILARLNQAQAEKISSAPGDRKAAYAAHESSESRPEH